MCKKFKENVEQRSAVIAEKDALLAQKDKELADAIAAQGQSCHSRQPHTLTVSHTELDLQKVKDLLMQQMREQRQQRSSQVTKRRWSR